MFCFIEHDCQCIWDCKSVLVFHDHIQLTLTLTIVFWHAMKHMWTFIYVNLYIYIYICYGQHSTSPFHSATSINQLFFFFFLLISKITNHKSSSKLYLSIKTFKLWLISNFEWILNRFSLAFKIIWRNGRCYRSNSPEHSLKKYHTFTINFLVLSKLKSSIEYKWLAW